ncbi:MAG: hypothetical protein JST52_04205 [Bacteroidetes bacterium]|nr:hypothetical protein [Bacteroidota bacterium]MBS1740652.1 hypothetical protein [Bacteroidota bacterium]
MSLELIKYTQPLSKDELNFIKRKAQEERLQLRKIILIFVCLSLGCPLAVSAVRFFVANESFFSLLQYLVGVVFLLLFSGVGLYWGYIHSLRKLEQDLSQQTKTIERVVVTKKQYMPLNHEYYVYLTSVVKLSIEVSEADFRELKEGSELEISYTTMSQLYLGYSV